MNPTNPMTPEDNNKATATVWRPKHFTITQILKELERISDQGGEKAFEIWYAQMADAESRKSFCKAGWMLYQLKVELDEGTEPATD